MERVRRLVGDHAFVAFSGGKDSLVAAHLAREHMGWTRAVRETSFNFARADADYRLSGEAIGLDVEEVCSLSDEWLRGNPQWVFGPVRKLGQFYAVRQQATIKRFAGEQ